MAIPEIWVLGELERLKHSLRAVLTVIEKNGLPLTPNSEELAVIEKNLRIWVKQHQKLKEYATKY